MEASAYEFGVQLDFIRPGKPESGATKAAPRNDRFQSRGKTAETPPTLERGPLGKDKRAMFRERTGFRHPGLNSSSYDVE
jgi:hypothetical protein